MAITDTIRSPKSHCRLVPLARDLTELKIKRKLQMLLPCPTTNPQSTEKLPAVIRGPRD